MEMFTAYVTPLYAKVSPEPDTEPVVICRGCNISLVDKMVVIGIELFLGARPKETFHGFSYVPFINQVYFCLGCVKRRPVIACNSKMVTYFLEKVEMFANHVATAGVDVRVSADDFFQLIQTEFERYRMQILKKLGENTGNCCVCAAPDPKKFCSKCRVSRYCSANCQTVDWREYHKEVCSPIVEQPFFQKIDCYKPAAVIVPTCFFIETDENDLGSCVKCAKSVTNSILFCGFQFYMTNPGEGGSYITATNLVILCLDCGGGGDDGTKCLKAKSKSPDEVNLIWTFVYDFLSKIKPNTCEPIEATLARCNERKSKLLRKLGKETRYFCNSCGKQAPKWRCSVCHITRYCDDQCQLGDWPEHKPHCKGIEVLDFFQLDKMIRL